MGWGDWGDWSDVVVCKCDVHPQINPVKYTQAHAFIEYEYIVIPKSMRVENNATRLIYLTAHFAPPGEEWIEGGAQMCLGLEKPRMFTYVSVEDSPFVTHRDWDYGESRKFRLSKSELTGDYWVKWYNEQTGVWEVLRSSDISGKKLPTGGAMADMAEEYFGTELEDGFYYYRESGKDLIGDAWLSSPTTPPAEGGFDEFAYDCYGEEFCPDHLKYNDIENGLESWYEC